MDSFFRTESVAIAFDKVRQIMHLSMLSPRGWGSGYPWGFDCEVCPQGGVLIVRISPGWGILDNLG